VIGFLALSWRHETLKVLAVFLGIWLLVVGLVQLASAFAAIRDRWLYAVAGLLTAAVGVVTIFWPHITLFVIAMLLAWTLLVWGILYIVASLLSREVPHWWIGLIKGIVLILLGVWAIRHPGNALTVLVVVFGLACVFWGILELIAGVVARHAGREWERERAHQAAA
jgi:uncharacterized membrane protein HdeD (DUF308 family)